MTYIKIISLEYSGSTLIDLSLGHKLENSVSLGEVERTIEPDSSIVSNNICSCGDPFCEYWYNHPSSYAKYVEYIQRRFPDKIFIDSSKTISSLNKLENNNFVVIFLYRECLPWVTSCLKRFFKLEVRLFRSKSKRKMLPAFIRIEILRRLLFPLPFEWLFRNLKILNKLTILSREKNLKVYAVTYESFVAKFAEDSISIHNSHIIRGNKISKTKRNINVTSTRTRPSIFDFAFNFFLARSNLLPLLVQSDLRFDKILVNG